jgi:hypothetical protein
LAAKCDAKDALARAVTAAQACASLQAEQYRHTNAQTMQVHRQARAVSAGATTRFYEKFSNSLIKI